MVTVRAPATSANLGSRFDVFGVAPDCPADIMHVERTNRMTIGVTGIDSQCVPTNLNRSVIGVVAETLDAPAHIRIDRGVRPSSGLGSSAASSTAATVALNELYDRGLSRGELVPVAAESEAVVSGEAHADSVAPALLGDLTVATDEGVMIVDADIPLVACLPETTVSTRDAHRVIPSDASIEGMVHTVGRAATLTIGMCRRNADLVGVGMNDRIVTPTRAKLINGYHDIREAALAVGATDVTVSGADPSILGVCQATDHTRVAGAIFEAFDEADVAAHTYRTRVGHGVEVSES